VCSGKVADTVTKLLLYAERSAGKDQHEGAVSAVGHIEVDGCGLSRWRARGILKESLWKLRGDSHEPDVAQTEGRL
jgi:hypothetical protein